MWREAWVVLNQYPCFLIPLKAMLMPGVWAATRTMLVCEGHSSVGAMPVWVGCIVTWGDDDI